jgi:hypothetical protein
VGAHRTLSLKPLIWPAAGEAVPLSHMESTYFWLTSACQSRTDTSEQGGQIPAVAVTAYASVRERDHALKAGYNWHLAKPVEADQLVAIVGGVVNPTSSVVRLRKAHGQARTPQHPRPHNRAESVKKRGAWATEPIMATMTGRSSYEGWLLCRPRGCRAD